MYPEFLQRARGHLLAGRPAEAAGIAKTYSREIDPSDPEPHSIYSQAALAASQFELALAEAGLAAIVAPGDALYHGRFIALLNHLAVNPAAPAAFRLGARALLDRVNRHDAVGAIPEFTRATRSIDLVLQMELPNGSERHVIETAKSLRRHVPTRIWSTVPIHPALLAIDPTIERITDSNMPSGETLAIMGTFTKTGVWLDRVRPNRIILHFNVFNLSALLGWLAAATRTTAERIDLLFPSKAVRDALGVRGAVLPSPIDLQHFTARPVQEIRSVGRISRDVVGKHHPGDPALYHALLNAGLKVAILGGIHCRPFFGQHPGLTVLPDHSIPALQFLRSLDLFLYRTGFVFESWGRVVTEAMACAMPVVCGKLGGYAEIIKHGENGFLFQTNEEGLAAIDALRSNPALARRVGEAARQTMVDLLSPAAEDRLIEYFVGQ